MLRLTALSSALSSAEVAHAGAEHSSATGSCDAHRFQDRVSSHGALQLCIELLQQPFNAREALVTFNREMQRLAFQRVVTGVEEGDHRRSLAEVAPGGLNQVALPPRLIGRRR